MGPRIIRIGKEVFSVPGILVREWAIPTHCVRGNSVEASHYHHRTAWPWHGIAIWSGLMRISLPRDCSHGAAYKLLRSHFGPRQRS